MGAVSTVSPSDSVPCEIKPHPDRQSGTYSSIFIVDSPSEDRRFMTKNNTFYSFQLPACVFPCVLAVVPPPKSVVADNAPKPFAEFSFIMSQSEHTNVVQIKYLHFLVQEFAIRIDNGLINAAISLFASEVVQAPPYSVSNLSQLVV